MLWTKSALDKYGPALVPSQSYVDLNPRLNENAAKTEYQEYSIKSVVVDPSTQYLTNITIE